MRLDKPYTNKQYAELAAYCNKNNCHIEDKGDYLEAVENVVPVQTLDEIKELKKKEINQWREEHRLSDGASYKDDLFDIDETSQGNATSLALTAKLMIDGMLEESNFVYRSKTNTDHNLTPLEMIELALRIGKAVSTNYNHSWELKALVDKATSKEEIDLIAW